MKKWLLLLLSSIFYAENVKAQLFYSNGATVAIQHGAHVTINGGYINKSNSNLVNQGVLRVDGDFFNHDSIIGQGVLTFFGTNPKGYYSTSQIGIGKLQLASLCSELTIQQPVNFNDTLAIGHGCVINNLSHHLVLNGHVTGSGQFKTSGTANLYVNSTVSAGTLFLNQSNPGVTNQFNKLFVSIPQGNQFKLGNTIQIKKEVNITSGILNTSGFLVLVSDSAETASITNLTAPADLTGHVTVQRYVPPVTRRSRLFSSPIQNFAWQQLIDDIFVSGNGGISNGFDSTNNNGNTCYTYNESLPGRGWNGATQINQSVNAGKGMLVFVRGNRQLPSPDWFTINHAMYPTSAGYPPQNKVDLDFVGEINKGNISPIITYHSSGVPANDGWNLVGNPYPCPINWGSISKTNLSPFYYCYNAATGSYEALSGSNPIAIGQGFFVQATAANPSIEFTEASKATYVPANYFKTAEDWLGITFFKDTLNSDFAKMVFSSNQPKIFSFNKDAIKLANASLNIAWLLNSDSVQSQIHTRAFPVVADTIPLVISASQGNYTLKFNTQNLTLNQGQVYLYDAFLNSITDIKSISNYAFSINAQTASQGNQRFKIIILPSQPLPLQSLVFNAKPTSYKLVQLSWQSQAEKNLDYYEVMRKTGEGDFIKIGRVNALNASRGKYEFVDYLPNQTQTNYYKLRIVEFNSSQTYSNIMAVNFNVPFNQPGITILGNPVNHLLRFKVTSSHPQNALLVTIKDAIGKQQLATNLKAINNQQDFELDVQNLCAGIYYLEVAGPDGTYVISFIKM